MLVKTKGIVISQTKYSESGVVVKIFTENMGIQSFFVRGLASKKSKGKAAFFQPLTILNMVVKFSEKKTLHTITEVELWYNYKSLNSDMKKRSILFFIDELLYKCLKEENGNKEMFNWICNSMKWLDERDNSYVNYHLIFMLQLTSFLGFFPTLNTTANNPVFNLQDGEFSSQIPMHANYVSGNIVGKIITLLSASYDDSCNFDFNNETRSNILGTLISYYNFHFPSMGEFKSMEVLRVVLS